MAWVRTATALIGFGFTIVQFYVRLSSTPGVAPARAPNVPTALGVLLVGTGVISLTLAFVQYLRSRHFLDALPDAEVLPGSSVHAWVAATAVWMAGIVALASIVIRMI